MLTSSVMFNPALSAAQAAWVEMVAELLWRRYLIRFRYAYAMEHVISTMKLMGVQFQKAPVLMYARPH